MADGRKNKDGAGIKVLITGVVLLCLVLGYYYYLSNKAQKKQQEDNARATAVQEVLLYNFERNYPPTPKEVVRMFGQITQCFYNEDYTEEEMVQMAMQIQKLYDEELIDNKTENQYIEDLKWDINNAKQNGIKISSYTPSVSTDVDFYSKGGFDFASLYCSFTFRKGTETGASSEHFLLRKDSDGHWKIYGWEHEKRDQIRNSLMNG